MNRSLLFVFVLTLVSLQGWSQNYSNDIPSCNGAAVTVLTTKSGTSYNVKIGTAAPVALGTGLTKDDFKKKLTETLLKKLSATCLPAENDAVIYFVGWYPQQATEKLFGNDLPILKEIINLDKNTYFGLTETPDKKYSISLFSKSNAAPIPLMQWNATNRVYDFLFGNFTNNVLLHLPELIYLKEDVAKLAVPLFYLRDENNGTYQLMHSIDGVAASVAGTPAPVNGKTAAIIRASSADVKIQFTGNEINLKPIKKYKESESPKPDAAAMVAPKSAATSEQRGALIADRQITCAAKTAFHILAHIYKPSPIDSVLITIRTATKTKVTVVPLDWSSHELVEFVKSDPALGLCNDAATDNILSVFFTEYTTKVPFLQTTARAGNVSVTSTTTNAAALADNKTDTTKKAATTPAATADSSKNPLGSNVVTIAGQADFAAVLQLQGKKIPLDVKCGEMQVQNDENLLIGEPTYLEIDSVVIQIFNNNIHQLDVVGKMGGKPVQTVSNQSYGLSLRDLIDGGKSILFNGHKLCYSNLFFVRPSDSDAISYNIADGRYSFTPTADKQKITQKRLLDFISLSAFFDLQSMNQNSANKNLLTEIYFTFPLKYKHPGRWAIFKYFYVNANLGFNLFNGDNNKLNAFYRPDSAFLETPIPNTDPQEFKKDTFYSPAFFVKNFDLIRNASISIRPIVNVASVDIKEANTLIDLNAGLTFLGSNLRYKEPGKRTDSITSKTAYSYGYTIETRFRINPKINFGADFHLSYNTGPRLMSGELRSITGSMNTETLVQAKMLSDNKTSYLQGELNLFFNPRNAKSSTDRGGFFVKLNLFKSLHYSEGHFMFLVGYSSDIKNFFK